ncbi:PREDICTED: glycoprotein Xg [Buceros rhinoceros silvestris]|uniref:glycoprotein Xg n=1 Tax=Buceros rhinoceros silvestris TaxID=175836 RepID=UPI0005283F98|nr:PREDICTED: glycoprotein Xg [Buceros rhinoceros silvestris]
MGKFRSSLLLCLGFLLVHVRGQHDFDLADALDHPEDVITRKPAVIRRPTRPVMNNDLNLGDALGGGDISRKPLYPPLPPRPGTYSNSGGFDDSDLLDGKPLPPYVPGEREHHFNHGENSDSGLIAGVTSPIISAFVILVVGSIAAYSAYKNKKLCFKPQGKTKSFSHFLS